MRNVWKSNAFTLWSKSQPHVVMMLLEPDYVCECRMLSYAVEKIVFLAQNTSKHSWKTSLRL